MDLSHFVNVINNCSKTITVQIRVPRPKKGPPPPIPKSIKVRPNHESGPLPYAHVVGTQSWDALHDLGCVEFVRTRSLARFYSIENVSDQPIKLKVSPKAPPEKKRVATIAIKPGRKSRPLDIKSISRARVDSLLDRKAIRLNPVKYIGPRVGPEPAVGSYFGENVYVCYKCGRPIVFRGYPPRPIHI